MTTGGDGRNSGARDPGGIRDKATLARPLPRRFYKDVAIGEQDGAWRILLDGRPARTPRKALLAVASATLARRLAQEWAAQGDVIDPARMPLTTLVRTALDAVPGQEAAVVEEILRYAGSDLLCYRADHPEGLAALQRRHWDPVLAWAEKELGAGFVLAKGIAHVAQPVDAVKALGRPLSGLDALRLAAVHVLTTLTGSAVLAVAVLAGGSSFEAAWTAAHVDEDWQISQWGEDREAAQRRAARRVEAEAAATVLGEGPAR